MRGRELKLMLCDSGEDSLPDQTESTQLGLFGETRREILSHECVSSYVV